MIEVLRGVIASRAVCDLCGAATPTFGDMRDFWNWLEVHDWQRFFPPGSKTHADELIRCGECRP